MDAKQALDLAKGEVRARKQRTRSFIEGILGARVSIAVFALFALAFGSQLHFAPYRLPPVGGLNLTQLGLWPTVQGADSEIGQRIDEEAGKAADAARRQARNLACGDENATQNALSCYIEAHEEVRPTLNLIGLIASSLLLLVTIWFQARQFRRLPRLG